MYGSCFVRKVEDYLFHSNDNRNFYLYNDAIFSKNFYIFIVMNHNHDSYKFSNLSHPVASIIYLAEFLIVK